MHTLDTAQGGYPDLNDPPFLLAILIGALRTGDKMLVGLARAGLAEIGIRITFAKDSPVLCGKAVTGD